ncbi:MAG: T9SS type A sorting domain-containing protein, partial [Bacteroidales bacterium]|nr:T9SS type A sorting domain-containing protein [Bacteroidales bacterium]
WKNSSFPGSLMIRPVMGKHAYMVGVGENQDVVSNLTVYPNPASSVIHLDGVDEYNCKEIFIYDLAGRSVGQYNYNPELSVESLSEGVYFLKVVDKNGSYRTAKLLISK